MSTDAPDRPREGAPEPRDQAASEPRSDAAPRPPAPVKRPLYPRLLRLKNIRPNGWQRAALGEGAVAVAAVLVLADVASAWTLLVLPLGVAAVVKTHDLLAGVLGAADAEPVDPEERSPRLGVKYKDLAVLSALLDSGADLDRPREVRYYCYAPDEPVARAMANVAAGRGFEAEVRAPAPDDPDGTGQWALVCWATLVVDAALVRENGDFFDDLAERYEADYDGWEAAV